MQEVENDAKEEKIKKENKSKWFSGLWQSTTHVFIETLHSSPFHPNFANSSTLRAGRRRTDGELPIYFFIRVSALTTA